LLAEPTRSGEHCTVSTGPRSSSSLVVNYSVGDGKGNAMSTLRLGGRSIALPTRSEVEPHRMNRDRQLAQTINGRPSGRSDRRLPEWALVICRIGREPWQVWFTGALRGGS
jgi:hypothetical protein